MNYMEGLHVKHLKTFLDDLALKNHDADTFKIIYTNTDYIIGIINTRASTIPDVCKFSSYDCLIGTQDYGKQWRKFQLERLDKKAKSVGDQYIGDCGDYLEYEMFMK